jgi:hypothetical protein
MLEERIDYDPTPSDPGEPPITMDEMYQRSVEEKRLAWS